MDLLVHLSHHDHGVDMVKGMYTNCNMLCAGAYLLALPRGRYPLGIQPDRRHMHQHSTFKRSKGIKVGERRCVG